MSWRRVTVGTVVSALALGGLLLTPAHAEVRWPPTPSTIVGSGPDAVAPQVASLGGDDAVAVWEECTCTGIKAAVWDGTAWSASLVISDPTQLSVEPKVTGTAPGEAIAVWASDDTFGNVTIQASQYSGGTWSLPVVISNPTALEVSEPHVAGRSDGSAVAVWVSTFSGPIFQIDAATFDAGAWTLAATPLSDPAGFPGHPRVATTGAATAVAVWTQDCLCGAVIEASTLNGVTWSVTPDVLSNLGDDSSLADVAATSDGGAVATWVSDTFAGDTLVQASRFDGALWTATADVSSTSETIFFIPVPGFEPQAITSAAVGQATVAWIGFDFGTNEVIAHAAVFANGAWAPPANLATAPALTTFAFPDITTVDPGVALVVWAASDGVSFSIQAATYDGTSSTPAVNVAPTSIYVESPQVAGTGAGTAVTVWIDGAGVDFIVQGARGAPASRTVSVTGGNVTIYTSAGGLVRVSGSTVPTTPTPPPGVQFPYGVFDFTVVNLVPGASTTITITLPAPVTQYWKLHGNAWYQLTGVTFSGNDVIFTLVDGGPDDADGAANGTIVDPGGPAIAALAAVGVIPRFTG